MIIAKARIVQSGLAGVLLVTTAFASASTEREALKSLEIWSADRQEWHPWRPPSAKVIVVDFWASWCSPCIDAFDGLRKLKTQAGDDVLFASVSREPREVIEAFLQRHEIPGIVAFDPDGTLNSAWKIETLPTVVVLGTSGVLWRGHSGHLDLLTLQEAKAGRGRPPARSEADVAAAPLFEASLRPATDNTPELVFGGNTIRMGFATVDTLIMNAWGSTKGRIRHETEIPPHRYDATVTGTETRAEAVAELRRVILEAFDLEVAPETRSLETLVLKSIDAKAVERPKRIGIHLQRGEIRGIADMPRLARMLENALEIPVVDDTGDPRVYEIDLEYDPEEPGSLMRALEGLGLAVVYEERHVEVLVVRDVAGRE